MPVSKLPTRLPAQTASYGPSGRGAGGGGSVDPDSFFEASDLGDWFDTSLGVFQDSLFATPASSGDVLGGWRGQRDSGTSLDLIQATGGSKPSLATDGTEGVIATFADFKDIQDSAYSLVAGSDVTLAMRVKFAGSTSFQGWVAGEEYSPATDGLGLYGTNIAVQTSGSAANRAAISGAPYYGSWVNVVGTFTDSTLTFDLYVDSTSPVATTAGAAQPVLNRYKLGGRNQTAATEIKKHLVINKLLTVADVNTWLSA